MVVAALFEADAAVAVVVDQALALTSPVTFGLSEYVQHLDKPSLSLPRGTWIFFAIRAPLIYRMIFACPPLKPCTEEPEF